ncbi:hypothetical protein M432DRAFT_157748 [Thermoascus aurantiacus ATCC 26904]
MQRGRDQDQESIDTEKENTNAHANLEVAVAVRISPPSFDLEAYEPLDERVLRTVVDLLDTSSSSSTRTTTEQENEEMKTATATAMEARTVEREVEVIDLTSPPPEMEPVTEPEQHHAPHEHPPAGHDGHGGGYDSQAEEDEIFARVPPRKRARVMAFITAHDFMKSYDLPIRRSARRRFTKQVRRKALKAGMDEASATRLLRYVRRCYVEVHQGGFTDGLDSEGSAFAADEVDDGDGPEGEGISVSKEKKPKKKRRRGITDDVDGPDMGEESRNAKRRAEEGRQESGHKGSTGREGPTETKDRAAWFPSSPRDSDRENSPMVLDLLQRLAESPTDSPASGERAWSAETGGPTPGPAVVLVEDDPEGQSESAQQTVGRNAGSRVENEGKDGKPQWLDGASPSRVESADYIAPESRKESRQSGPSDTAHPEIERSTESAEDQSPAASSGRTKDDAAMSSSKASDASKPSTRSKKKREKKLRKKAAIKAKVAEKIRLLREKNAQRTARRKERRKARTKNRTDSASAEVVSEGPPQTVPHSSQPVEGGSDPPGSADVQSGRQVEHAAIPAVDLTRSDSGF